MENQGDVIYGWSLISESIYATLMNPLKIMMQTALCIVVRLKAAVSQYPRQRITGQRLLQQKCIKTWQILVNLVTLIKEF